MVRLGLLLWDWACSLGSGVSLSLSLFYSSLFICLSALPICWWPQILVVAFIVSDGLKDLGQTMIGVTISSCDIQGLSLSLCWPGSGLLALG